MFCATQLITYKVITLGQHGKVTGQQPGSLDSARGSSGHAPQIAGEPPQPPSREEDDHALFEGIQVFPWQYCALRGLKRL